MHARWEELRCLAKASAAAGMMMTSGAPPLAHNGDFGGGGGGAIHDDERVHAHWKVSMEVVAAFSAALCRERASTSM